MMSRSPRLPPRCANSPGSNATPGGAGASRPGCPRRTARTGRSGRRIAARALPRCRPAPRRATTVPRCSRRTCLPAVRPGPASAASAARMKARDSSVTCASPACQPAKNSPRQYATGKAAIAVPHGPAGRLAGAALIFKCPRLLTAVMRLAAQHPRRAGRAATAQPHITANPAHGDSEPACWCT